MIRRCQTGQLKMLEVLIQRYKDPLYHFCLHLCKGKSAADDLFQDTWVRVLANIQRLDPDRPFKTWLFTVAANLYKDRWRKRKRWLEMVKDYHIADVLEQQLANLVADTPAPDQDILDYEQASELRRCLETLSDNLRIPVILYYFQELTVQEISQVLGIPPGTVKTRLHSARGKLKTLLEVT
ncbi:MAG: sigma-70 family RNA polymerase sigma factor [Firmicutes bacterium]|nr:sigma-70 family RNA polymerase sigma factor [Bacillota bacterium]